MLITNLRWWTAAIMEKIEKSPYLSNGLTNRRDVRHDDAFDPVDTVDS